MLRTMMPIYILMATHHPCEAYPSGLLEGSGKSTCYWRRSDEVISMVNKTFINAGDSIVISVPAFSEYGLKWPRRRGGHSRGAMHRETGQYDFKAMRQAVDDYDAPRMDLQS